MNKVLKLLIEEKEYKHSIRNLSKRLKLNYKSVYETVKRLEKDGSVKLERFGNSIDCHFTETLTSSVFRTEQERRKELFEDLKFKIIHERLNKLTIFVIVLLFGSHARGTASKHSDIDLLIVCNEKDEKSIQEQLDLLPFDIHPTFVNPKQFVDSLKTKEYNVVAEAVKRNIILIGIDDYYRLIEIAKTL